MAPNKNLPLPATPMTAHSIASIASVNSTTSSGRLEVDVRPHSAVQIGFASEYSASAEEEEEGEYDIEVDMDGRDVNMDTAPNTAAPAPAPVLAVGQIRSRRGPTTPPAMADCPIQGQSGDQMEREEGPMSDAVPPPPAYSTLANSSRTFHLAPLLNGLPGEVELQTSDGKRFLVHKSVLEKETVFFHIYYGFVPSWRLNLTVEESVGLPPNPHLPSVIQDAPSSLANLPPPPPFSALAAPGSSSGIRAGSSSSSSIGDNGASSSTNARGLSGLWSLPKILTNVCASASAAASGVVAGTASTSSASVTGSTARRPSNSRSSLSSSSSPSSRSSRNVEMIDADGTAPLLPPKDEPASPTPTAAPTPQRRSLAAPPPPPPSAPTPTTSPYVWTVPEPSSILYAFLSLIYPAGTISPCPTYGLNSIDTCTRVIRAAMGYQSNKAISLARAHLWGYLYRLEDEEEQDRFASVQQQQARTVFGPTPREAMHAFERRRTLDRQAVRVYALASYFKFTDLAIVASQTAFRVPRDEWSRSDVAMMGRTAAGRLVRLQEARRDAVSHTLEAAQREQIMQSQCVAAPGSNVGCDAREGMKQVWSTRCAQVSEAVDEAEGSLDAETVGKMLLDPVDATALGAAGQSQAGCVGCMQEYGRCVGLVLGVLRGMPESVAVIE